MKKAKQQVRNYFVTGKMVDNDGKGQNNEFTWRFTSREGVEIHERIMANVIHSRFMRGTDTVGFYTLFTEMEIYYIVTEAYMYYDKETQRVEKRIREQKRNYSLKKMVLTEKGWVSKKDMKIEDQIGSMKIDICPCEDVLRFQKHEKEVIQQLEFDF